MSDYSIVHFVEPQEEGASFKQWPLRLELVPKFDITDIAGLDNELQQLSERQQEFSYIVGQFAIVGSRRRRQAQIIQNDPELTRLHYDLSDIVERHGEIHATSAIRERFEPHIRRQGVRILGPGSAFLLDSLYLVKGPGGESEKITKKVTRKYHFGS